MSEKSMPLHDEISKLKIRATSDLIAAHDYYSDALYAWELARKRIEDGLVFSKINLVTQTKTSSEEFVGKASKYITTELAEATFMQFNSIFESFIFDFIATWLIAFPDRLTNKKFDVRLILESPDKAAMLETIARHEANSVIYERPAFWFDYIEKLAKLGCPSADEIGQIAEAKASRDVLIHNRGVVNGIYLEKSGQYARHKFDDRVEISERHHHDTFTLLTKVVENICGAGLKKAV